MLISFSGLDGAGKSTLIEGLWKSLQARGHAVVCLRMYDHVVFYAFLRGLRDRVGKIFGRRRAAPGDPKAATLYRVARSPMTKRVVLFLDLISLVARRFYEERMRKRILILDRYLYDFLADVADLKEQNWSFVSFFIRISPVPDLPVFVDVPAERAYERKREYPLAYMEWRRRTYHKIFNAVSNPLILENDDLEETRRRLEAEALKRIGS